MTTPKPFHSIYAGNPDMQHALEAYVLQLRDLADHLEDATREHDVDQLRDLCSALKREGKGHGFEEIANLADEAINTFKTEQPDIDTLEATVHEIIDVARRTKAD